MDFVSPGRLLAERWFSSCSSLHLRADTTQATRSKLVRTQQEIGSIHSRTAVPALGPLSTASVNLLVDVRWNFSGSERLATS